MFRSRLVSPKRNRGVTLAAPRDLDLVASPTAGMGRGGGGPSAEGAMGCFTAGTSWWRLGTALATFCAWRLVAGAATPVVQWWRRSLTPLGLGRGGGGYPWAGHGVARRL
jgi:hypothetical protein